MAKIKGIKALNKAITEPLNKRFGITKAECGNEYVYTPCDRSITYKLTENTMEDAWFIEFITDRFNYEVRYPFIISLLHEVGHDKTLDDLGDDVYSFCLEEKERINVEMEKAETEEECKKLEWQYFNLPDEIMATAWAVKYAKAHPRIVKKMWKQMMEAFGDFYRKNGLYDEIEKNEKTA